MHPSVCPWGELPFSGPAQPPRHWCVLGNTAGVNRGSIRISKSPWGTAVAAKSPQCTVPRCAGAFRTAGQGRASGRGSLRDRAVPRRALLAHRSPRAGDVETLAGSLRSGNGRGARKCRGAGETQDAWVKGALRTKYWAPTQSPLRRWLRCPGAVTGQPVTEWPRAPREATLGR